MSTYTFECPKCHKGLEVECRMSEHDKLVKRIKCPECKTKMKQTIEGFNGFWLHGHGWSSEGYGITQREMNATVEDGCKADPTCEM